MIRRAHEHVEAAVSLLERSGPGTLALGDTHGGTDRGWLLAGASAVASTRRPHELTRTHCEHNLSTYVRQRHVSGMCGNNVTVCCMQRGECFMCLFVYLILYIVCVCLFVSLFV